MTEIVKKATRVDQLKSWFGTPETTRAIKRLAGKHLDPTKLLQMAVQCVEKNPKIADCSHASVVGCILTASSLGLELGMPGGAWPVPFKGKCQLIIDYRGLMKLARRSGEIQSIEAHVVYAKDEFEYTLGVERKLHHRPFRGGDRGDMTDAYAVCHLRPDGYQFEVMTANEINTIRKRSPSGDSPAWRNDESEMWRKTVIRRLCKFLPSSSDLQRAVALDEQHDAGLTQDIDIVGVQSGGSQPALPATVDEIPPSFDPDMVDAPETDSPARPMPQPGKPSRPSAPGDVTPKPKDGAKPKPRAEKDTRAGDEEYIRDAAQKISGQRFNEFLRDVGIDYGELSLTSVGKVAALAKRVREEMELAATQAANGPTDGADAAT